MAAKLLLPEHQMINIQLFNSVPVTSFRPVSWLLKKKKKKDQTLVIKKKQSNLGKTSDDGHQTCPIFTSLTITAAHLQRA